MLKFEFKVEPIIIFIKSIKKASGYVHFVGKPVIWTAIILPSNLVKIEFSHSHNLARKKVNIPFDAFLCSFLIW